MRRDLVDHLIYAQNMTDEALRLTVTLLGQLLTLIKWQIF